MQMTLRNRECSTVCKASVCVVLRVILDFLLFFIWSQSALLFVKLLSLVSKAAILIRNNKITIMRFVSTKLKAQLVFPLR